MSSLMDQFGINLGSAPQAPDLSALQAAGSTRDIDSLIANATKEYDNLGSSIMTTGVQNANSAAATYAGKLQQQGINPISSGVVAAQAKLPLYAQQAQLQKDKNQMQLDGKVKAQSLAAQVQQSIGQLNLGYAQTLADYNTHSAQVQLSAAELAGNNKYRDQDLGLKQKQLDLQAQSTAAQVAASQAQTQAQQQQNYLTGQTIQQKQNPKTTSWMPYNLNYPAITFSNGKSYF